MIPRGQVKGGARGSCDQSLDEMRCMGWTVEVSQGRDDQGGVVQRVTARKKGRRDLLHQQVTEGAVLTESVDTVALLDQQEERMLREVLRAAEVLEGLWKNR
jgi:hypothetical protein